ncbi:MAG: tail fiber assembly protein [Symbiopectobacterium sp.]|uniref:tail fiber assembly protein n=1 Tax=Symbiopectobacterium sp. TaxID=2952789 RepID=UPI003F2F64E3
MRESRIDEANELIIDKQWPSKLTLGRLSDADKSLFNLWLDYLDNLDVASLVLSNVVDEDNYNMIIWPDKPEG